MPKITEGQRAESLLKHLHSDIIRTNPSWLNSDNIRRFWSCLIFHLFIQGKEGVASSAFLFNDDEHVQSRLRFDIINTPLHLRDSVTQLFPYISKSVIDFGDITLPFLSSNAIELIRHSRDIKWNVVCPSLLGVMLENVTDSKNRHQSGMHYTNTKNTKKLIDSLFMNSLTNTYKKALANKSDKRKINALLKLRLRVGAIKIFDPACGGGNMLIAAYRALRNMEFLITDTLQSLGEPHSSLFPFVTPNNFHGIEYDACAADVAKKALIITELQLTSKKGEQVNTFESPSSCPGIHVGSALQVPWGDICRAKQDEEVFICGNPPYLGFNARSAEQQQEHARVMKGVHPSVNQLDYVCNWFVLAAQYISTRYKCKYAFVTTNSVSQGVHVPRLWPFIFKLGLEINFAHIGIKWESDANNQAAVDCAIVGLRKVSSSVKFIHNGEIQTEAENINPYLVNAPTTWVKPRNKPNSTLPSMLLGSVPKDGGGFILSPREKDELLSLYPKSSIFIRQLSGSQEILKGVERYCLWITKDNLSLAVSIPIIADRIASVRDMRLASKKINTRQSAQTPYAFNENRHVENVQSIVIPRTTSGSRKHIPVFFSQEGDVVNDSAFFIPNGELWHFAILSSSLHRIWLSAIAGKLKGDYRYSNTMVWNTFPLPSLRESEIKQLNGTAHNILKIRDEFNNSSMSELYRPDKMPPKLTQAHVENDRILNQILGLNDIDESKVLSVFFSRYKDLY